MNGALDLLGTGDTFKLRHVSGDECDHLTVNASRHGRGEKDHLRSYVGRNNGVGDGSGASKSRVSLKDHKATAISSPFARDRNQSRPPQHTLRPLTFIRSLVRRRCVGLSPHYAAGRTRGQGVAS